jgi:dCMP deaminase
MRQVINDDLINQEINRVREHHAKWMRVALAIAAFSKCPRAQYGVIVLDRDGRIVSSGYNGKPSGAMDDDVCYRENCEPNANKPNCCLHAEMNALVVGDWSRYEGGSLYITGLPCETCAGLIAQARIASLVCLEDDRDYPGLEVLKRHGFVFSTQDARQVMAARTMQVFILRKHEVYCP